MPVAGTSLNLLPGGIGTLEELFEIWAWAQLGFHQKPCGLINVEGYFDSLIQFLDHMFAEQFVKEHHRSMLIVEPHPEKLLAQYINYQPTTVTQWVGKDKI